MKITKSYLKQIIKEEMQKVLNEKLGDLNRLNDLIKNFKEQFEIFKSNKNFFLKVPDDKKYIQNVQAARESFKKMDEIFKNIFFIMTEIRAEIEKTQDANLKNLVENLANLQGWINSIKMRNSPSHYMETDKKTIEYIQNSLELAEYYLDQYLTQHSHDLTVGV